LGQSANTKWLVGAGCGLVAAIAIYLTFFRASDEDQIKKCLSTFATIVSVKENDTIISRTARMRSRMQEVVRDDVQVTIEELNIDVRGREKLEDDAVKAGLAYSDAECTFIGTKIEIDPAKTFAKVDATAIVTGSSGGTPNPGGGRKVDKRDVHFLLRKDGDWKIDTLRVSRTRDDDQTSP
jgi:hypothetical protein